MNIKEFKIFAVGNPPPQFGGKVWLLVKLTTDNNIVGWGESYCLPFHAKTAQAMIADVCERYVVGESPFAIEKLFRLIHASGYTGNAELSLMAVISGIEIALWDIVGKALERPIYDLLGGQLHPKLRSYSYLYPRDSDSKNVYTDPDTAAERALELVNQGFTAVKFDPIGGYTAFDPYQLPLDVLRRSEQYVKRIREAVGDRADLLFGSHGQMTAASAIRLAKRLEAYDPLWLEEPVPPENADEMARVAHATSIPVATGERLAGKHQFLRLMQTQAASILQMNLGRVGGILEAKKIASMAEAFYLQIAPHLYCGPIVGAASVQLSTCSPNFLIQESIEQWDGFHEKILTGKMVWQDGYIIPPRAPGLGVEVDEAVAEAHPYTEESLHLSPVQDILFQQPGNA